MNIINDLTIHSLAGMNIEAWLVERESVAGEWTPCRGGVAGTRFYVTLEDAEAEARAWSEDGYTVRVVPLHRVFTFTRVTRVSPWSSHPKEET